MNSPEEVMPWVGLYTIIASLICTVAMTTDVIQGFCQWKLWFPNRFFTLNATTITLIAIAMKLPVDLSTEKSEGTQVYTKQGSNEYTKKSSIIFLVTMLANFLPSLGRLNDKELLTNIVALGILVITVVVNMYIQTFTQVHLLHVRSITFLMFPFVWPFSVALTVSASRKKLEYRYKESQQLVASHQEKRFSSKGLKRYVKQYWMMTETRNPQFVIACSPVSSAFGVICLNLACTSVKMIFEMKKNWYGTSDYKWSLKIIFIVQTVGVIVGSIAPIFRCFASIGHYNLSSKWSKNHLNVFRVEKHWNQRLQHWKRSHVHSNIPGQHCKIVFHNFKTTFLNCCLALHIVILVVCKTVCLFPKTFLILLSCCWYLLKSFFKRFKKVENASNSNVNLEIQEYTKYVLQIEEDEELSKRLLRNTLHSISQLIDESEKKEPRHLIKFLEKSTGFNGVLEFENDEVPPLCQEETHNCWSLVLVTLTTIVIALPNNANDHFKGLLACMREGLQIVKVIEECLDAHGDSLKARKAAKHVWSEVELHCTWLQINLQKKARKGKKSKEILKWLGDEAAKIVIQFKSSKKPSIDHSLNKFILASSMYKISNSVLLHLSEQENWLNDEELIEWISTMIGDILCACFTNLPHAIKMKCHHHEIDKRGDNIRNAAQLLGKTKKILKILKARQFPNIDLDSMSYIDSWHVLPKSQIPNGYHIPNRDASSARIQFGSSSCNESLIVTFM